MATTLQLINDGTQFNDPTADNLRAGAEKLNANFEGVWAALGSSTIAGSTLNSLGSMASQNASTVSITGGTISGVTITNFTESSGSIPASSIVGVMGVSQGGTGLATFGANFLLVGPSTGAAAAPTVRALLGLDVPTISLQTSGQGGVSGNLPATQLSGALSTNSLPLISLSSAVSGGVSGVLGTVNGGTGVTSAAANTFLGGGTSSTLPPVFRAIINADLPLSGVTSGTVGSASFIPVVAVNDRGIITSLTSAAAPSSVQTSQTFVTKTSAYTTAASDAGLAYDLSSAPLITLVSGGTFGIGKFIDFRSINSSSVGTVCTIAAASGTIDGRASISVYPQENFRLFSDGSVYTSKGRKRSGDKVLLLDVSASTVASADFSAPADTELHSLEFHIISAQPTSAAVAMRWATTASVLTTNYSYSFHALSTSGVNASAAANSAASVLFGPVLDASSTSEVTGKIFFDNYQDSGKFRKPYGLGTLHNVSVQSTDLLFAGLNNTDSGALSTVRFLTSTGGNYNTLHIQAWAVRQ